MEKINHSDFLSLGDVESFVQSKNSQLPDSHELPSINQKSSIFSLTLDESQRTFSGDLETLGSMNIEELLNNVLTTEEIQAYDQTLLPNPGIALNITANVETTTIPTTNINPQFSRGKINTSIVNDTTVPQSLQRQGSFTIPSPMSQNIVDEMWHELQNFQQEHEYSSVAKVQEINSIQHHTTSAEMTFEDFLTMIGVVQAHDHPPTPTLKQSHVLYQNNNNRALGSGPPDYMVSTVMASKGGKNMPAYQESSGKRVKDVKSITVGKIPCGNQPREVQYGGEMQNNTAKDGWGKRSPASLVFNDSVGTNQSKKVNNIGMNVNVASMCSGSVENDETRKQERMIKNRESAARSRARRQNYTRDMEAELRVLKKENAHLQQALEAMKARKGKDGKKGIKRSWSCMY